MNKMWNWMLVALLCISFLCGCSLAKEDAGEEEQTNMEDRLVGVVITTEHLDLFDVEAFLNDNINELTNEKVELTNTSKYNGRIYATVDKHGSEEPQDWELVFEGLKGIHFINATCYEEDEEPFKMGFIGDEIFDVNQHFSTTDEGEFMELSGSIYALMDENTESTNFYLNPVYQTSTGEIYVTTGNGISGHAGEEFSLKLESETTITENEVTKI